MTTGIEQTTQPTDLTGAFRSLQSLLLSLDDVESFLEQVAELAAATFDAPSSCGITLLRGDTWLTVGSSDRRAGWLDETQYATTDGVAAGPCLHAARTGQPVWVPQPSAETRWPEYTRRARELNLQCSLSLPLQGAATWPNSPSIAGALNVYQFDSSCGIDDRQRQQCELFAAQACGAIQLASARLQHTEHRSHLEAALQSRTVIDQALGILMAQRRCTATEAFTLLREASQRRNIKLRDVAGQLIERVSGCPPESGRGFDN